MRSLDGAIDELERIDVSELSDGELHHLVLQDLEVMSRLAAVRARHVAEWNARRIWASDGSKAGWGRLARECSLTAATAKTEIFRSERLRSMPATANAFEEGKLTVDQVDLLTSACQPAITTVLERDEQVLVDEVRALRLPDAKRLVDYWIEAAFDAVGKDRLRPNPDGRHLSAVRTFNGNVDVQGRLDPIAGTEFLTELTSIEQELFEADWAAARAEHGANALPSHLPRTAAQRRADAQVQMARNSRACRQGAYRQPRPLLTVHTGLGSLYRMCELADGTVVSPSQVFPLLTEADVERIVFDSPSRVLDVGVRQRFFTGALRRAIEVRDRHC